MSKKRFFISSVSGTCSSPSQNDGFLGAAYYLSDDPSDHFSDDDQLLKIDCDLNEFFCFGVTNTDEFHTGDVDCRSFLLIKTVFQLTTEECNEQIQAAGLLPLVYSAIEEVKHRGYPGVCVTHLDYQTNLLICFNDSVLTNAVKVLMPFYFAESSADHRTVWVHCSDGSTVGRFSEFGIDIHNNITDLLNGASSCLFCTHEAPSAEDWEHFRTKASELWDVDIPEDYISKDVLSYTKNNCPDVTLAMHP